MVVILSEIFTTLLWGLWGGGGGGGGGGGMVGDHSPHNSLLK